ncbi:MAG TPA: hypothetical protein VFN68_07530 [Acidimicrobiales bacterium]|nr:hypothetical protein [Acidimicrobiales bacterium]
MAVGASAAVAASMALTAGTAVAATMTNASWSVSNNQVGATGVQYTYNFTTATATTIDSITETVPTGTAGAPSVVQTVGIGAGTIALSGTTLTYTVTTPVSVAAGIPIELAVGGLTNTTTAGSYTSTVTTLTTASAAVDTVTTPSVSIGADDTAVAVNVAESTSFSTDTSSFTFNMDPSLPALATQSKTVNLAVTSNAANGYTLSVKDAGLKATSGATTYQMAAASSGMSTASTWPGANHFGYAATVTGSGGSPVLGGSLATSGDYAGYTTAGENLLTTSGPTGNAGVSLALANKVQVDYSTPAGAYSDTITYTVTYTVTPSY